MHRSHHHTGIWVIQIRFRRMHSRQTHQRHPSAGGLSVPSSGQCDRTICVSCAGTIHRKRENRPGLNTNNRSGKDCWHICQQSHHRTFSSHGSSESGTHPYRDRTEDDEEDYEADCDVQCRMVLGDLLLFRNHRLHIRHARPALHRTG